MNKKMYMILGALAGAGAGLALANKQVRTKIKKGTNQIYAMLKEEAQKLDLEKEIDNIKKQVKTRSKTKKGRPAKKETQPNG